MRKKGNVRKQVLYDWMIFQTKDAEFSEAFTGTYSHKVEQKRQKLGEIEHGNNQLERVYAESEQEIEKCTEERAHAGQKKAEASEGLDELKSKLHGQAADITDALLKAIHKQLASGKPAWGDVVEHFAGILKNIEDATPKHVLNLIKDHKKLQVKLEKRVKLAQEHPNLVRHT